MERILSVKAVSLYVGRFCPYWLKFIVLGWLLQGPGSPYSWAQSPQSFIYQLVPIEGESGDIVYTDVVPVAGASPIQLYNRAHSFLDRTLQAGSLLPITHGSKHHISRCGIVTLDHTQANRRRRQAYRVTIDVKVKAGQYRYRLSQFRALPDSLGGLSIRDLYRCDTKTYEYADSVAQQLRAWDRSVKTYLSQLQEYMAGRQEVEATKPL